MSLDKLAIIFFIIILPISVVLSAYTNAQIDTLNIQVSYDSKLKSATYDAVQAFQINTLNSSTSDLANSKIRDIEASVNAFFNSMSTNFNVAGYNTNTLQEYVPALVYTMYDGYYIYSPYTNTIPDDTYRTILQDGTVVDNSASATYKDGDKLYGLKPYIYYSCEYKKGDDNFVITYSLDNYITIQGKIGDNWVNDSGYVISNIKNVTENSLVYRETTIYKNQNLMKDNLIRDNGTKKEYLYHKINGVKYYYDSDKDKWFSILNGKEIYTSDTFNFNIDSSAYNYYKEAYEFMLRLQNYGISDLKSSNAVGGQFNNPNYKIFDFTNIEEPNSGFNQHRLAVIRHSIERNLSIAIANYNNYTNVKTDFLMPKLKEDEWDRILNNISVISFMQGLDIGTKVYNGYAIVANNNNEEVVAENAIYIANKGDSIYHNILEKNLNSKIDYNYIGIFNMDLQRRVKETDFSTQYYYPKLYYGDYDSVVYQTNVVNLDVDEYNGNIYQYMDNNPNLARIYYNSLGRERYGMYKVNRNVQKLLEKYK